MSGRRLLARPRDDAVAESGADQKRDELLISKQMAWAIIILGVLGSILQPIFAGVCLFVVVCNYGVLPNLDFVSYYRYIAPSMSFGHIYVGVFSGIINGLYALWAWVFLKELGIRVVYTIALAAAVITFAFSLNVHAMDQAFYAMGNRDPTWYRAADSAALRRWRDAEFSAYKAKDVVRCIFFIIQALTFTLAYRHSSNTLAERMGIGD
jgi:hypothetical protein